MITKKTKSHSKLYLGIDPASDGAAVALFNGAAVYATMWRKVRRKSRTYYEVREIVVGNPKNRMFQAKRFSEVGNFIAQSEFLGQHDVHLSAEDAYFKPNAKTTIALSRLSGAIVAPIELKFDVDAKWVRAADWRHKVLRLNPFTPRQQAKNASLKLMPSLVSGIYEIMNRLGRYDHITDASGVAYWAYQKNK